MLRLSTKGRYGVRLMLDLAQNYGKGPIALKDVAKRQEISEKYLEHLITPLRKEKLIRARRGAHGGYMLVKAPGLISLQEIIAAVEGPVCIVECAKDHGICKRSRGCISREVWRELSDKISETLKEITLEKIIGKDFHNSEGLCYNI